MTATAKAIDADVTAALDRWAAAIGTPGHRAASEALDALMVDLCADRRAQDDSDLLTYLMDWASGTGLLIRHVAPNPETWMDKLEEIPVLEVANGETVWDALRRDYAKRATSPRHGNVRRSRESAASSVELERLRALARDAHDAEPETKESLVWEIYESLRDGGARPLPAGQRLHSNSQGDGAND